MILRVSPFYINSLPAIFSEKKAAWPSRVLQCLSEVSEGSMDVVGVDGYHCNMESWYGCVCVCADCMDYIIYIYICISCHISLIVS